MRVGALDMQVKLSCSSPRCPTSTYGHALEHLHLPEFVSCICSLPDRAGSCGLKVRRYGLQDWLLTWIPRRRNHLVITWAALISSSFERIIGHTAGVFSSLSCCVSGLIPHRSQIDDIGGKGLQGHDRDHNFWSNGL